jgi:YegS/Rv2252/BmrU family lipid kinase
MVTRARGNGSELARAAVAVGSVLVIAHGGDGTIMEVAAGIVGTGIPIGLLPAGTGNRLAANLGISWNPLRAADIIAGGRRRAIDLGVLKNDAGTRYFAVTAGCGFDAELMHHTPPAHKKAIGVWAYTTTAISLARTALKRAKVRIETDDTVFEGHAATVLVANCGNIVPYLPGFGPHIRPDDGVLDVIVLDAATFAGATRVAWRLMVGKPGTDGLVTYLRTRRVVVMTEPALAAQADGDAAGFCPFEAEVMPGGLTALVP